MQHAESSVKIYFTKEYGLFKIMTGNRPLNENKIRKIKQDICNGIDVLKYCPVIVHERDGRLEIIDGQHRFYVAKQLGSHVWYIVAGEMSLLEIAKVNSNTEKWKPADFINCYAVQGNEHYVKLREFIEETHFPLSVALQLLGKGLDVADSGGGIKEIFQEGQFIVTNEEDANKVKEVVEQFEPFGMRRSRVFVVAICKIMQAEKVPVQELITAFKANPDKLSPQSGWKEYMSNLEVILNIGKKVRRVLY